MDWIAGNEPVPAGWMSADGSPESPDEQTHELSATPGQGTGSLPAPASEWFRARLNRVSVPMLMQVGGKDEYPALLKSPTPNTVSFSSIRTP